jgi:hypothetical protein
MSLVVIKIVKTWPVPKTVENYQILAPKILQNSLFHFNEKVKTKTLYLKQHRDPLSDLGLPLDLVL